MSFASPNRPITGPGIRAGRVVGVFATPVQPTTLRISGAESITPMMDGTTLITWTDASTATPGSIQLTGDVPVDLRIFATAAGGRGSTGGTFRGGGGGAGRVLPDQTWQITSAMGAITISVGAIAPTLNPADPGGDTVAFGFHLRGGSGGGDGGSSEAGRDGGSGGGGRGSSGTGTRPGGSAIGPDGLGFAGGASRASNTLPHRAGGGGGGAGGAGTASPSNGVAGDGGPGVSSDITGTSIVYGAGGGGAADTPGAGGSSGAGGAGSNGSGPGGDATTFGSGSGGSFSSFDAGDPMPGIAYCRVPVGVMIVDLG